MWTQFQNKAMYLPTSVWVILSNKAWTLVHQYDTVALHSMRFFWVKINSLCCQKLWRYTKKPPQGQYTSIMNAKCTHFFSLKNNNKAEYYALLGCAAVTLNTQVQTLLPEYMYHITQGHHTFIFMAMET